MKDKTVRVFLVIFLSLGSVVMMFPFVWMVLNAFKTTSEILAVPPSLFPKVIYLGGYVKLFSESPILYWFRNSLVVVTAVVILQLFTSSLSGYIFAKFDFRFKTFCFIMVLLTLMIPFQVIMIPVYLIVSKLHLLNTLYALIVPSMVSAFGLFLCKQFIETIPTDLIHAARIDGAGEFRIYGSIILPNVRSTLSALAIFTFMGTWNDYLWPLITINDTNRMTIPLALNFFSGQHSKELNVVMAACTVVILPEIIVYLLFQKQFIQGMALSGMKA